MVVVIMTKRLGKRRKLIRILLDCEMERTMGIEPTTLRSENECSTTELRPRISPTRCRLYLDRPAMRAVEENLSLDHDRRQIFGRSTRTRTEASGFGIQCF